MRYLIMIGLFALAIYLFKKFIFKQVDQKSHNPNQDTKPDTKEVENMVRCQQCSVHLPQPDAITSEKGIFCSRECEQKFKQ